ncbi:MULTISPECIES: hypothetical protein [Burkholderia]|uniref:Uncharacterized protein n=1 Tax=Burkholderia pyrrocinia TaxID=60550 RepID=A0A318IEE7_BURPY|nr:MULTISPECIES: hypothetical protein [Burkholderia]PXX28715.1 hypothetical protein NA66_1018115 [Burkholderia pyrrocinia]SFW84327.1 hypothetical protein SAMN03159384_05895 [Burkholderia sp. NFACC33-1]SFY45162.1 hypothetical protein SAMN03159408_06102 [Burkholderia sp. NFPP32]
MRKTPTANRCRQAPGSGANGDITLKGFAFASPTHVARMHFMRIDFGDGFVLRSPSDVLGQLEAKPDCGAVARRAPHFRRANAKTPAF